MDSTEVIAFVGIAAAIIITQLGHHPVTLRRFLLPLGIVGIVAYHYLQRLPTSGGALDFELILTITGVLFGLLASALMRIDRDQQTGKLILHAGLLYAALWIAVFGGRLAFAWAATHVWQQQVRQFAIDHAITSNAAWTDAFVLMAVAMVLARTLAVGGRVLAATEPSPRPTLA